MTRERLPDPNDPERDELQSLLWRSHYDLLSADEREELERRLAASVQAETAAQRAEQQLELLARASRVETPRIDLQKPRERQASEHRSPVALPPPAQQPRRGGWLGSWPSMLTASAACLLVALTSFQALRPSSPWSPFAKSPEELIGQRHVRMVITGPATLAAHHPGEFAIETSSLAGVPVSTQLNYRLVEGRRELLKGELATDARGNAWLKVPPTVAFAHAELEIEAVAGAARARAAITRDPQGLAAVVTADRKYYARGDQLRCRVVVLDRLNREPVDDGAEVVVRVLDGDDQPVLPTHRTRTQSGVAEGAWTLGEHLAGGRYYVEARHPSDAFPPVRRAIEVGTPLPALRGRVEFARPSYAAGDEVVADLQLEHATGKPLAHAPLRVSARVGRQSIPMQPVATDAEGAAKVRFQLPAEQPLAGNAELAVAVSEPQPQSLSYPIPVADAQLNVAMFPEGGSLVAGVPCRVYFQATDGAGAPASFRGRLVAHGKTLQEVETEHDGRGVFALTPQPATRYALESTGDSLRLAGETETNGGPKRFELPIPHPPRGRLAMQVRPGVIAAGEPLSVTLQIPPDSGLLPDQLLLTASCQGVDLVHQRLAANPSPTPRAIGRAQTAEAQTAQAAEAETAERVEGREAAGDVTATARNVTLALPAQAAGVLRVTVFDCAADPPRPLAERLVYRHPGGTLEVELAEVELADVELAETVELAAGNASEPSASRATPLRRRLKVIDEEGKAIAGAVLGLAVVDQRALEPAGTSPHLVSDFYLTGGLSRPEDLERANLLVSPERDWQRRLDLLLATHGWREFVPAPRGSRLQLAQRHAAGVDPRNPPAFSADQGSSPEEALAAAPVVAPLVFDNQAQQLPKFRAAVADAYRARRFSTRRWAVGILWAGVGVAILAGWAAVQQRIPVRFGGGCLAAALACALVGWGTLQFDDQPQELALRPALSTHGFAAPTEEFIPPNDRLADAPAAAEEAPDSLTHKRLLKEHLRERDGLNRQADLAEPASAAAAGLDEPLSLGERAENPSAGSRPKLRPRSPESLIETSPSSPGQPSTAAPRPSSSEPQAAAQAGGYGGQVDVRPPSAAPPQGPAEPAPYFEGLGGGGRGGRGGMAAPRITGPGQARQPSRGGGDAAEMGDRARSTVKKARGFSPPPESPFGVSGGLEAPSAESAPGGRPPAQRGTDGLGAADAAPGFADEPRPSAAAPARPRPSPAAPVGGDPRPDRDRKSPLAPRAEAPALEAAQLNVAEHESKDKANDAEHARRTGSPDAKFSGGGPNAKRLEKEAVSGAAAPRAAAPSLAVPAPAAEARPIAEAPAADSLPRMSFGMAGQPSPAAARQAIAAPDSGEADSRGISTLESRLPRHAFSRQADGFSRQADGLGLKLGYLRRLAASQRRALAAPQPAATVYWDPLARSAADGTAEIDFQLPATGEYAYRLTAHAHGRGRLGTTTHSLAREAPLSAELSVPPHLLEGDSLVVPFTVRNESSERQIVTLQIDASDHWVWEAVQPVQALPIPVGGSRTVPFRVSVLRGPAEATAALRVAGATAPQSSVRLQQSVRAVVAPRGFPVGGRRSGVVNREANILLEVPPAAVPASVRGTLRLAPSPLAELKSTAAAVPAADGRESDWPLPEVYLLRYLDHQQIADPDATAQARRRLDDLFQRLAVRDSAAKGQWDGLKLVALSDLARVWQKSPRPLEPLAQTLLQRAAAPAVPADTGTTADTGAPAEATGGTRPTPPVAVGAVERALIAWGLAEMEGELAGSAASRQLAADVMQQAARSTSAAEVALAALVAARYGPSRAQPLRRSLEDLQAEDGRVPAAADGPLFRKDLEVTSLAVLAWLPAPEAHEMAIRRAVQWIKVQGQPRHGFSDPRTGLLVLKTLSAFGEQQFGLVDSRGGNRATLVLELNDQSRQEVVIDPRAKNGLQVPLTGLQPGSQKLRLSWSSPLQFVEMPYEVNWESRLPAGESDPESPLALQVAFADAGSGPDAAVGELGALVGLDVRLTNVSRRSQSGVRCVVPLPAGLAVDVRQLDQLRRAGQIDRYALTGESVVLTWETLSRDADASRRQFTLQLRATTEGTFGANPAYAYVDHAPQRRSWSRPLKVQVQRASAAAAAP